MKTSEKTVADFGEQWNAFQENTGHYASLEIFKDILGPQVNIRDIKGASVADIGSGTGRIVNMLAEAGAKHIVAIEPSACFPVLKKNTAAYQDRITYLNVTGEKLASEKPLDFIFSFGVLHHIPDPDPVVKASFENLKPGGRIVVWLYGREGNEIYLTMFGLLHFFTKRLSHAALSFTCRLLLIPVRIYGNLAPQFKFPMHDYFSKHFMRLDKRSQLITLYDQLNPTYARYYRREEAISLLTRNGFKSVEAYHRHGYSWTVVGQKS